MADRESDLAKLQKLGFKVADPGSNFGGDERAADLAKLQGMGFKVGTGDAPADPPSLSVGDMAEGAVENFIPSVEAAAEEFWNAVTNPGDTLEAIGDIAVGGVQKLIPGERMGREQHFEAVRDFFVDRYGSGEAIKRTIRDDPAGFLMDISTLLTGGAGAAVKAPGMASKLSKAARATNPAIAPVLAARKVGETVAKAPAHVAGFKAGTGADPIRRAYAAGREGTGEAFKRVMRGGTDRRLSVDNKAAAEALNSWVQKGRLGPAPQIVVTAASLLSGGVSTAALAAAGFSPRIIGEASLLAGRAAQKADRFIPRAPRLDPAIINPAYQATQARDAAEAADLFARGGGTTASGVFSNLTDPPSGGGPFTPPLQ